MDALAHVSLRVGLERLDRRAQLYRGHEPIVDLGERGRPHIAGHAFRTCPLTPWRREPSSARRRAEDRGRPEVVDGRLDPTHRRAMVGGDEYPIPELIEAGAQGSTSAVT
jgi:hypothetical protein